MGKRTAAENHSGARLNDYEVGKRHALPMINIPTLDFCDVREKRPGCSIPKVNESDVYLQRDPGRLQKLSVLPHAVVAAVDAPRPAEEIKPHDSDRSYGDRGGYRTNADRPVVRTCRCTGKAGG